MAINKVPTLLVGLGGIGCSIADMTASMLDDETKKYVNVLLKELGICEDKELKNISYYQYRNLSQNII